MSKKKPFTNQAFQKSQGATEVKPTGFNLVTQAGANAFNAVFDTQAHRLNQNEEHALEQLLRDNYDAKTVSREQFPNDLVLLKHSTQEIRAIANQGAYLIGERIAKVREVLKRYKQETFVKWLEMAVGSKKSGYNFLSFYELWKDLPNNEVKDKYQRMPKSIAYMLASRSVGLSQKITFIDKFFDLKPRLLLLELRKSFPSPRSSAGVGDAVSQLKDLLEKISEEIKHLSDEEIKKLKSLQKEMGKMTMKYLAIPQPKKVNLEKIKAEDVKKLIKQAWQGGERTIVRSGDFTAAIVPLEDLVVLEDGERG